MTGEVPVFSGNVVHATAIEGNVQILDAGRLNEVTTYILNGSRPQPEMLSSDDIADATVANLNQLVVRLLLAGHVMVPRYLKREPQQLLGWVHYARPLEMAQVHAEDMVKLQRLWAQIDALSTDDVDHRGECAVATRDDELMAATVPEFIGLLRTLRDRAKDTTSELAKRACISRSQLYSMLDLKRSVLPTRVNQVKAFAQACGLPPSQVDRVMSLWLKLYQAAHKVEEISLRWYTPDVHEAARQRVQASVPKEELEAALARPGEAIADGAREELAIVMAAQIFSMLDEDLAGKPVLLPRLAPSIVKMLQGVLDPESGSPTELALEVGFLLGMSSAARARKPSKAHLVM